MLNNNLFNFLNIELASQKILILTLLLLLLLSMCDA